MSYCPQPSAVIDSRAIVVVHTQVGLAGVKRHAHSQRAGRRPGLIVQRLLKGGSSGDCVAGAGEDSKAAIALAAWPHHLPMVVGDDLLDEHIVPYRCLAHGIRMLLPERGAALDVS